MVGPAHVTVRVTLLLVRPAVLGRKSFQSGDLRQRRIELAPVAAADRTHVQRVGVFRLVPEDVVEVGQCFVILLPHNPGLNGGQRGIGPASFPAPGITARAGTSGTTGHDNGVLRGGRRVGYWCRIRVGQKFTLARTP